MITKKCSSCGQEFSCDADDRDCDMINTRSCSCINCWIKRDIKLSLIIFEYCSKHNQEYIKLKVTEEL